MKIKKLFQKTRFGIFALFGVISLSTSALCIYTVDTHLSEEYENNSKNIAKTIADSSVDILLNRDLAALQSLIDQFVEIQSIKYIYITDESGEFLAHTFVPGIPEVIRADDPFKTEAIERNLPGMGDFVEVGSPILAGIAGTVHVGMDTGLIALKNSKSNRKTGLSHLHHTRGRLLCRDMARQPRGEPPRRSPRLCSGSRAR